jgi:maltooligosyltrehalose trehalohydrolase
VNECETLKLGATLVGHNHCNFRVWAPFVDSVDVHIVSPDDRVLSLKKDKYGYHEGLFSEVKAGSLYFYILGGAKERPDPASRFQPEGVHGPSQILDTEFPWTDSVWSGISLLDYVIYEIHVGAFTPEGTFEAVISELERLVDLGITAIELMPVAQFPGNRNWGYDGVYPFAVQNSYGGPVGLKSLIDACHQRGLAVVLDVVCNHLGPEGNYLGDFGPYFTDRYTTPWGQAINFDGPHSDQVRRTFLENALYWVTDFHVDALRIDAVHNIFDFSAFHFLEEMATAIHCRARELKRKIYVIAESDRNDSRLIKSSEIGGYGLDALWNDDFHHALHALLSDERTGYYGDFGRFIQLVKAFKEGFVFSGEYSVYRSRRHGNSSAGLPRNRFVVFSQNHDQVGNRLMGDRLSRLVSFEQLKLAAGAVILSPYIPLLFMGEEYGEIAPFPYFISHSDPFLIESVRQGRKEEFAAFLWRGEPMDPQDESSFGCAKLNQTLPEESQHASLYKFYTELLKFRKTLVAVTSYCTDGGMVIDCEEDRLILVSISSPGKHFLILFHFGEAENIVRVRTSAGSWKKVLDSAETAWAGPGSLTSSTIVSNGYSEMRLQPASVLILSKL